MTITRTHVERLALVLDGYDKLGTEVVEVALSTNGATGKVDAKLTIAHTDRSGILDFAERSVEL
jgi:hypothetical protein